MATTINASVGTGTDNHADDVRTVQGLLNDFAVAAGFAPLAVNGVCDAGTIAAITQFQARILGFSKPDGRVDPGGRTIRGLNAASTTAPAAGGGKVTGDLDQVNPKILMILQAVAAHYNRPIRVTSGQRSPTDQARAMWQNWTGNLKRGTIYRYLSGPGSADRVKLDAFFNAGNRAAFDALVVQIAGELSMHLTGEAVDLAPKSDVTPAMRAALETYLHLIVEESCYHFDTRGKTLPDTLTAADRSQWPAA